MIHGRVTSLVILIVLVLIGVQHFLIGIQQLQAIPAFARKYGKPCQTCHVSEPKLNEFGERFRANGFQLPGTIEDNPPWAWPKVMMAGMLHEMAVDRLIQSNMDATPPPGLPPQKHYNVRSFRDAGGHIWFGGTMGRNLSFLTSLGIEQELEVENGRFGSPSHAHWDFAFFQYNNIFNSGIGAANIKFGSFELELPFSNLRRLSSALAQYEVYNLRGVKGSFKLSSPQVGTSLNGLINLGLNTFRYEVALINGTNRHFDSNVEFDTYSRLAVARLFDNSLGMLQRVQVGGLFYSGTQNLKDMPGNPYPTDAMLDYWMDEYGINVHANPENTNLWRKGFDFSVDLKLPGITIGPLDLGYSVNIYGQFLTGHDDDIDMTDEHMPLLNGGEEEGGGHALSKTLVGADEDEEHMGEWITRPFDFEGGFIGADVVVVPSKLYFITRYDWVNITNQWADPIHGEYVRENLIFSDDYAARGDDMPYEMTGAQKDYSRYTFGFRWHLLQPVTIIYEYGYQNNLFGYPEPPPIMYNPDWVAGMGRVVNVDSDWHMFMVMFAF
ncbi:MAG TPA: hypothetical protein EYN81_02205 [Candidatus Marinimicrobia bacterium]|nr:hypothetical protein [Candidatus Neomarinimicrobiota bacterium]HIB58123.1 hypothetical protein [Candidatus Neomarinimicrobiota bacterium]HIN61900.1 hypothetical protein [Candidatus Neomarinimicrobiota bacterium]